MKKYLFIVLLVGFCFGEQKSNIQPKISTNEYHYLDIICLEEKQSVIYKNVSLEAISNSNIVLNNKKIVPLNSIIGCYGYLDKPENLILSTLCGVGLIGCAGLVGYVIGLRTFLSESLSIDSIFEKKEVREEKGNRFGARVGRIAFYTATAVILSLYSQLDYSKTDLDKKGQINMRDWSNEEKIEYFNKYNYLTPLQNK